MEKKLQCRGCGSTQTADEAFQWIGEVDDAEKWEDLDNPGKFAVLDSKLHVALLGVVTGDLKRQIQFEIEKLAKIKRLMRGRSIAWMIFKHFEISDQQLKIKSLNDLLCVGLQGDHIKKFLHEWDTIIEEMVEKPSETMKQELFRRQVDKSTKLHDVLMHYDMVLDQSGETSDYESLRKAIDKFLAQRKQQSQRLELARSGGSSSHASKKLHSRQRMMEKSRLLVRLAEHGRTKVIAREEKDALMIILPT